MDPTLDPTAIPTLDPSAFSHHPNKNCYNGNGADNLSEELNGQTLEEVMQICNEMANCDGFGFQTPEQNSDVTIGRYWLRSNIRISRCVESSDLDMYLKAPGSGGSYYGSYYAYYY